MKYIRTKDGRIIKFDTRDVEEEIVGIKYDILGFRLKTTMQYYDLEKEDIVKITDTIEELIMPRDLVRYDGLYMSLIEKDRGDKIRGIDMRLIPRKSVDMLCMPTGNDTECHPNFKLVAIKEDDKGELVLL